jgi:hypothetical protein
MNFKNGALRERAVKNFLENSCDVKVSFYGQGAGCTERLSVRNRPISERFAPDLKVAGTNIFVEVTGTYGKVSELWIRKEKIFYAVRNPEKRIFVAFVNGGEIEVIPVDDEFKQTFISREFPMIKHTVDGQKFSFVVIKYPGYFTRDASDLVECINETKGLY